MAVSAKKELLRQFEDAGRDFLRHHEKGEISLTNDAGDRVGDGFAAIEASGQFSSDELLRVRDEYETLAAIRCVQNLLSVRAENRRPG